MSLTAHQWGEFFRVLVEILLKPHLASFDSPFAEPNAKTPKRESGSRTRDAINDLYTMFAPIDVHERQRIDRELKLRGLPALHVFEAFRNKKYQGILKRRKMRDQEEFYIVKGLLDDQLSDISCEEMAILEEIMSAHMAKIASGKQ